ncbi:ABC transporter ATP-binding protein/permease [Flavobacteriaceae bacterium]|nr:ABC transporter ATP-binding protein/permease [Flavobacteriaceae bacterium]
MIELINKIRYLIDAKSKKYLILLSILLIIATFLEVFGLGIILPLISIIIDPDYLESNKYLLKLQSFFGNISKLSFINYLLFFIVLLYFLKSIFIVSVVFVQNKLLNNIKVLLSNKLFHRYIFSDYSFLLKHNSSILIKNIQTEVGIFQSFCSSLISLTVESFTISSIILVLLFIDPLGIIVTSFFLTLFSALFFYFTKKKIHKYGIIREVFDKGLSKTLIESFDGIKTFKIMNKENFIYENFSRFNIGRSKIQIKYEFLNQIPRFYLEFLSITGLIIYILYALNIANTPYKDLVITLGVFVAAVFKILPSFNKIISVSQNLKYNTPSINLLHKEFLQINHSGNDDSYEVEKFIFKNHISIVDLNYRYSEKSNLILKNIDLKINKGDCIGVFGKSGGGKSTFIDIFCGLLLPTSGRIAVDGNLISTNLIGWRMNIGYVSQNIFISDETILNNIALGVKEVDIDKNRVIYLLKLVDLSSYVNSLPNGFNTILGEKGSNFSGGQKQRIAIARALYHDPEIIIFDEATSSLDSDTEKMIMDSIYKLKTLKTIIIVSHKMDNLKECDNLYNLRHGEFVLQN